MLHWRRSVCPSPRHHLIAVVPGIVYVYVVIGRVIAEADHGVAFKLDEHRPSGIYLGFVLVVGKPLTRTICATFFVTFYVLVEHPVCPISPRRPVWCCRIPVQIIPARLGKQPHPVLAGPITRTFKTIKIIQRRAVTPKVESG